MQSQWKMEKNTLNVESRTWHMFLQHNFKGVSCADFHTFLRSRVQLLKKIQSTQMYEWACKKGNGVRTGDRLYTVYKIYKSE
jgi:hypothetical protein